MFSTKVILPSFKFLSVKEEFIFGDVFYIEVIAKLFFDFS